MTIGPQKEAVEQFRAAVRLAPRDAALIDDLGAELAQAGLSGEALPLYRAGRTTPAGHREDASQPRHAAAAVQPIA